MDDGVIVEEGPAKQVIEKPEGGAHQAVPRSRPGALRRLEGRAEAALARIDPRPLFAVAATASGLLLIALQSQLSFTADDWDYLLNRRGLSLDVLLRPHVDHIVLGPVAVYKAIQSTIGMEKLFPYAMVSTAFVPRQRGDCSSSTCAAGPGAGSRWPGSSRCCSWARRGRCCCGRSRSPSRPRWRQGSPRSWRSSAKTGGATRWPAPCWFSAWPSPSSPSPSPLGRPCR